MNRNECWMAACVAALVVGVSMGQAQDKPAKPEGNPAPKILYIPPVPFDHPLALELVGLEAVGCRVCAPAAQTAEAKCKSCTGCAECSQVKTGECCSECAKSKTAAFASDCAGAGTPVKKVKKSKTRGMVDYFQIAVPPPPPMPAPGIPFAIYSPAPIGPCPMSVPMSMPMSSPAESMMVFRSAAHATSSACGSCGCDSGVQQAKHETGGKFSIAVGLGLTHGMPMVQVATGGQLEIECGGGCKMKCEHMTLSLPDGKELTITPMGQQVVVTGPSLSATCDTLARSELNGWLKLQLHGNVHVHQGKAGMKADVESHQVVISIHEGVVEVQTVMTAP